MTELERGGSIHVDAAPEDLYDLVADVTRTGEWSPVCQACWWDDPDAAGTVGARFTGHNETPDRTWETRSTVVAADPGHEFAWVVGDNFVRWGYTFTPAGTGTEVTESWHFQPDGLAYFKKTYTDTADDEIAARSESARTGIPATLEAIKRIAESASA